MRPHQNHPRVTADDRSVVVKLHENRRAMGTISKDTSRMRVAGGCRLNDQTPSNAKEKTQPHTACKTTSSILTCDAKSLIRECIRSVVANSKKRLHSPEAQTTSRTYHVKRPRHHSLAGDHSVGDASDKSKRSLVRAVVRKAALTPSMVRVRFARTTKCTFRFSAPEMTTFVWIGPALISATRNLWKVLDVIEPCRIVVDHHDAATLKRHRTILAFNTAQTNAWHSTRTSLLHVEVSPLKTCFRRESKILDSAVVHHFSPFTNLIYARCDAQKTVPHFIAKIDSRNTIHCLHCKKTFKSATQLAEHVRLPTSTQFKTFSVDNPQRRAGAFRGFA